MVEQKDKRMIVKVLNGEYEILKPNSAGYERHGRKYSSFISLWNWYRNEKDKFNIEFGEGTSGLLEKLIKEDLKEKRK